MKRDIITFIGFLLGLSSYAGLIQFSNSSSIEFAKIIFDPKPWAIAFIATVLLSCYKVNNSKEEEIKRNL